jgi:hypothetical protein
MKTLVILDNNYLDKISYNEGNFAKVVTFHDSCIIEYKVSKQCIVDFLDELGIEYSDNWLEDISTYQVTEDVGLLM